MTSNDHVAIPRTNTWIHSVTAIVRVKFGASPITVFAPHGQTWNAVWLFIWFMCFFFPTSTSPIRMRLGHGYHNDWYNWLNMVYLTVNIDNLRFIYIYIMNLTCSTIIEDGIWACRKVGRGLRHPMTDHSHCVSARWSFKRNKNGGFWRNWRQAATAQQKEYIMIKMQMLMYNIYIYIYYIYSIYCCFLLIL